MNNLPNILYFVETGHIPLDSYIIARISGERPFFDRLIKGNGLSRDGKDKVDGKNPADLKELLLGFLRGDFLVRRKIFLNNIEKCYTDGGNVKPLDYIVLRLLEGSPIVSILGAEYMLIKGRCDEYGVCSYNGVLNILEERKRQNLAKATSQKKELPRYDREEMFDSFAVARK